MNGNSNYLWMSLACCWIKSGDEGDQARETVEFITADISSHWSTSLCYFTRHANNVDSSRQIYWILLTATTKTERWEKCPNVHARQSKYNRKKWDFPLFSHSFDHSNSDRLKLNMNFPLDLRLLLLRLLAFYSRVKYIIYCWLQANKKIIFNSVFLWRHR